MMLRAKPLKRSPIKKHRPKRKPGFSDPKYRNWLAGQTCFVCFWAWLDYVDVPWPRYNMSQYRYTQLQFAFMRNSACCGHTEVAHVGVRGLGQRCKDRDALPLGSSHHRTGQDAAHVLGKKFWGHHGIDREEALEMLRRIYREETGNDV